MKHSITGSIIALATLFACGGIAPAQDKENVVRMLPPSVPPIRMPIRQAPEWSNEEAKAVGMMVAGSWKTTQPVASGGSDAASDIVVSVAPVFVMGMKDTMYVEMARADGLNRPYRSLIWRLVSVKGTWHLQSHEFRRPKGVLASTTGLWAAPNVFPILNGDDLVATMDIPLKAEGGKVAGMTPVGYATSVGGAVEMTSQIEISAESLNVADRGFDAAGKQVWGPEAGKFYSFAKTDLGVKVKSAENGLVVISYPAALTGEPAKDGELVTVNYAGYLENGTVFDSSYERNQPFQYAKGSKLIEGWNIAMADVQAGMKRRVVIPQELAYGERGSRGKVPPLATLIFDLDVVKIDPAPAAPPAVAPAPAVPVPGAKAGGPSITPVDPPPAIKEKMEADMRRRMEERAKKEAEKAADPANPK
ncbi:MAG: CpcT/CpeT family chromophore lyase [Planctomycetota bacterium]|nr:CpcT/CpeT family chromophore lyase [Planctomycetota bacterium]